MDEVCLFAGGDEWRVFPSCQPWIVVIQVSSEELGIENMERVFRKFHQDLGAKIPHLKFMYVAS